MLIFEQEIDQKLELLRYAIDNHYAISFWYRGEDFMQKKNSGLPAKNNVRFGEPVALGRSNGAKGGWMLRLWQTGGVTNRSKPETGSIPAWKTLLVDEMNSITIFDGEQGGYKSYPANSSGFNFNRSGDRKMRSVEKIMDPDKPAGADLSKKDKLNESSGFLIWLLNN